MEKLKKRIVIPLAIIFLWIAGTTTVYQFANPEKTFTQALLHIPKSVILNFHE